MIINNKRLRRFRRRDLNANARVSMENFSMAALAVGHVTPNASSVSSRTYSGKNSPAANFGMRKAQFVRLIHIPVLAQPSDCSRRYVRAAFLLRLRHRFSAKLRR